MIKHLPLMNWLNLNTLRGRYAVMTLALAVILLSVSWFAQNQIGTIRINIQRNIESRTSLIKENRQIQNSLWRFRDLLAKFQIDPKQFNDRKFISRAISQTISNIQHLSIHPWINENYKATVSELVLTLHDFDTSSKKLIAIRLSPAELFPSLKIADSALRPLSATFIENLNLAIKEIQDSYTNDRKKEYLLLIQLRYQWTQMISQFRMYMLNRLNSFQESYLPNQINLITERQNIIIEKLKTLNNSNQQGELSFNTNIALEKINLSGLAWIKQFKHVRKLHESGIWRSDTIIYQNELEPKLEKISALLHTLDNAIEQFNDSDVKFLFDITQFQVNSLWAGTVIGLLILLTGFIFLVKLILKPIAVVTQALNNESKGIETTIDTNTSILETRHLIAAFSKMREQIHSRQVELEYHALHDSLTGLANRELLHDRILQAIHNSKQDRTSFAILIMDLDRFKEVNDTLGHSVGDKLLQQVAKRLVNLLREVDIVARLGGDEFAILINIAHDKTAQLIAQKIINEFKTVFTVDDTPLYVGISIGISIFPQHGTTSQLLQQRADVAMYVAKRNKTQIETYDEKGDEYSVGKLSLISDLRKAIDENQLTLHYQPVVELKTGHIVSAEALLRWAHPTLGNITPDEIIPIAEQTGLINPITHWVIDTAAKYLKKLKNNGLDIKIAVNLSVYNLQEYDFIEEVQKTIKKNDISATNLIMEVTESVMMSNPQKSLDVLNELDKLGIEIAVDDFGTGYSSLTYLKRLPLSKLKIDKSFIMDMLEDDNDAMIVRSTIDLAHNLGMGTIAEGIEKKESMQLLSILGCELGQGYYFSRPINGDEFEIWVTKWNKRIYNEPESL